MENSTKVKLWSTAILAGGQSSRFAGTKVFARIAGQSLIRRVAQKTFPPSKDLMVAINPQASAGFRRRILRELRGYTFRFVEDSPGVRTPAAGIEVALISAAHEYVLVVASDMPFVPSSLFRAFVNLVSGEWVVVPFYDGFYEPLCAMYSKKFLPIISQYRQKPKGPLSTLFERPNIPVLKIDKSYLLSLGEPEKMFFNINTRDDLSKALEWNVP